MIYFQLYLRITYTNETEGKQMNITQRLFGELHGQEVMAYTMTNDNNMSVTCISLGGIITKIQVPDQAGKVENVVLGYDSVEGYLHNTAYFGAVVGRVAGRIHPAKVEIANKTYELSKNEGEKHLHGGDKAFSHVIWNAEVKENQDEVSVTFTYDSPDGENGYPGNLKVSVMYTLTNENEFKLSYQGISDQDTLLNMTNHTYFNLSGNVKRDVLEHELTMKSDAFLELNDIMLPTGEKVNVTDTAFDLREGKKVRAGVESQHPQNVKVGNGYDHPFLLSENQNEEITVVDYDSGRKLIVETDQPCVVLYTANMLENTGMIRDVKSREYLGLCLETQNLPNAIHHAEFPSIVLEKNKVYSANTMYRFATVES